MLLVGAFLHFASRHLHYSIMPCKAVCGKHTVLCGHRCPMQLPPQASHMRKPAGVMRLMTLQVQAVSKKKRKEEKEGEREEPQQQSAAVLARGRLGHAVRDWFSPRLMVAGGGLFMSLSRWGILPSVRPLLLGMDTQNLGSRPLTRRARTPFWWSPAHSVTSELSCLCCING